MKHRISIFIIYLILLLVPIFVVAESEFDRSPFTRGPDAQTWEIREVLPNDGDNTHTHADDPPALFEVGDKFTLKEYGKDKVRFEPEEKMRGRDHKHVDFQAFKKTKYWKDITFLCAKNVFNNPNKKRHMVVISPSAEEDGELTISYTGDSTVDCEAAELPAHGGLAHAHTAR